VFYINGGIFTELPFRTVLPDGRTRTSLHELSDAQLAELGVFPCDEIKPALTWTQHYGAPVIEVTDGRATATYPVLDHSPEEVAGILEAARERKRSEIAAARFDAETAGIDGIKTDRESQALITGAALKAMQDEKYSCRWKTESGFVELSALQISAVADAVRTHVQGCFDREAELLPLIEAATSPEELAAISY
jgi:hypothetical protein